MALSKYMIIGIAALVLTAIAFIAIYLFISSTTATLVSQLAQPNTTAMGPITGTSFISNAGVFSYNNSKYVVQSAIVNYNYQNVTRGTAILNVYTSNPIRKIYLVNVGFSCFKCIDQNAIYSNLSTYLGQYGLLPNATSFSEVNITDVSLLPRNSTLIIPSGLMPSVILPLAGSTPNTPRTDIIDLLSRGDTIIYVGYNFSRSIQNGINYISSAQTLSLLAAANMNSTKKISRSTSNTFYFDTPSFDFYNGTTYGPVTYVHSENGTFIAFSNYPASGWSGANTLSHDISLALYGRFWMKVIEQSPVVPISGMGQTSLYTTSLMLNNTPTVNNEINKSYALVKLQLFNRTGSIYREIPFTTRFENNGTLGLPAIIGEGQSVPVSIYVNTPSNLENIPVGNFSKNALLFHLQIYNSSLAFTYSLPIGFFNTSLGVNIYTTFAFKPGYYSASLRDINDRIYENALFYLPPFKITPVLLDFKNGTFSFTVINNNQSVSGISYQAEIDGAYPESGSINNGQLAFTIPKGSVIPYGNQTIQLSILGTNYSILSNYPKPSVGTIPPLYIEFAIAAVAIVILNLVIKAPNRDDYFIDVPLFPPTAKVDVRTTSNSVLGIFDSINERFGWKYMPLTAEEIKSGISSNIRYNNMPIMITMGNSTAILYKLANRGEVDMVPPYFMPSKWKDASHHDIEYLVIFRKLRDFAVKSAILFTDLDAGGSADMIITNRGVQSYIYIHSKTSGIRDVKIVTGTRTFIVFLDAESRAQFLDKLSDSYGNAAEKLRMGIATSSITLIDAENLEQLLY